MTKKLTEAARPAFTAQLCTGRERLRVILDTSVAWVDQVEEAGADRELAIRFLIGRIESDLIEDDIPS